MRRLHESEEAELAQYEAELKAKYGHNKADAEPEPQEDELVQPKMACPQCGERRMNYLIPDHNAVRCQSCGTVYEL